MANPKPIICVRCRKQIMVNFEFPHLFFVHLFGRIDVYGLFFNKLNIVSAEFVRAQATAVQLHTG